VSGEPYAPSFATRTGLIFQGVFETVTCGRLCFKPSSRRRHGSPVPTYDAQDLCAFGQVIAA
jgi:hypothetical protein